MKTLSDLKKRIVLGTKIVKVDCCHEKFKPETLGKVRTVDHVQGNAFTMDGSWIYYQKSSDYEFDGDFFSIYWKDTPHTHENLIGKYQILGE